MNRATFSNALSSENYNVALALFFTLACLLFVKKSASVLFELFSRYFVVRMEIDEIKDDSRNPAYYMVLHWSNYKINGRNVSVDIDYKQDEYGKYTSKYKYFPANGTHYFKFNGRVIKLRREANVKKTRRGPSGMLILSSIGRDKSFLDDLLSEAENFDQPPKVKNRTLIYSAGKGYWSRIGNPRRLRPLSSVFLRGDVAKRIMNDLTEFSKSEDWYIERGIQYRRGYLLYGPPGCGKSSFVKAIAGELGKNICIVPLSSPNLSDEKLNELFNSTPENSIILLEDIDAAFKERRSAETDITFSGFLNALDGVASTEQRIIFMTTNFIDRLEPALIRPGRVDVQQLIDYPSDEQVEAMFKHFYPECDESLVKQFCEVVESKNEVSMATLQNCFLAYKFDPQKAVEGLAAELI
ncbi:mitochondrial chaperone BCS1-like protein [Dinothrombium tinctorium]|uniref:Mitochondrial chaperone BCS1 n=1 Tax=Dinothrombium tinctorium TaxID=1965070 RepID=A0A3S4RC80_9ACAR|nr:mitochondrial chaperone BCS1-like protein [Dinothrombium tinctorium]RWS14310.1 mitochondrial chaperone BCS1-like protein [Dinothrombium tinctorium]RWS14317.1 mitochondrial chaperone BCS1-like protein [Dinothrombium tinctorium]